MAVVATDKAYKEKLIRSVKKEVKQIMEEAVTRKFVHEDSASVTSLCAAVEACVSHGLKRRALGLFKSSSTTALLHKVAKTFQPAARIMQLVAEVENCDPNKRSSSGSESASKIGIGSKPPLQKKNSVVAIKYLWLRLALTEKQLAKILDYIVQNSSKYYEKDALVSDPDYGSILSSLLVGPCALDFSKLRTGEHLWTDPPADELIQRHRISSGHFPLPASPPIHKRPALHYRGHSAFSNSDDNQRSKDYVESLHQNNKSTLLYGKNNVQVYLKEESGPLAGYLSLHQCGDLLSLKWTPNQLMNGCQPESVTYDKSLYWQYALNLPVHEIVYVHCHQGVDSDCIVMVGQDGVQRPPIHFPRGGHLLAFLSCLETGLLPNGTLDPPLWSQHGKDDIINMFIGKVFPRFKGKNRLQSRSSTSGSLLSSSSPSIIREESVTSTTASTSPSPSPLGFLNGDAAPPPSETNGVDGRSDVQTSTNDVVFRIIYSNSTKTLPSQVEEMIEDSSWKLPLTPKSAIPPATPRSTPLHSISTTSSTSSSRSLEQQQSLGIETGEPIQIVCQTMRKQIISRAFYGWLAHCRHLRTVRTHLVGLVLPTIVKPNEPTDASQGLTESKWEEMKKSGVDMKEVYRYVYFGGMAPSLRKKLWPVMLSGNVNGQDPEKLRKEYEDKMSEWIAVEAIVRQRDREIMAANLAKLSSEGTISGEPGPSPGVLQTNGSNDVFEDDAGSPNRSKGKLANGESRDEFPESAEESSPKKSSSNNSNSSAESSPSRRRRTVSFGKEKDLRTETLRAVKKKRNEKVVIVANVANNQEPRTIMTQGENNGEKEPVVNEEGEEALQEAVEETQKLNQQELEIINTETRENKGELVETVEEVEPEEEAESHNNKELDDDNTSISSDDSNVSTRGGGVYSNEILEAFGLNIHRIDKDVKRCDRNYWYFTESNLDKLKNVMYTYVWEHMDIGYVQGMCDLAAPLLVILDDEAEAYGCFRNLMERMSANFPSSGGAMDTHFANMRSLLQILDHDLFALIRQNGDYTHFYFCYRWFLLDFKREFLYEDVFLVWETIWAARHVASQDFGLFLALALLNYYRDIILANSMDFTDIIKFFNEMAERHDAKVILQIARSLVLQLQTVIENK